MKNKTLYGLGVTLALASIGWAQNASQFQPTQELQAPQGRDSKGRPLPEGMDMFGAFQMGDKPGRYSYWTAEPWTGDEKPFLRIRQNIDRQVKAGKKPTALLKAYRAAALKNMGDAQAQFRWAYAAFTAYQKFQKGQNVNEITKGVAEALERPRSPKSYQYARMRAIFTLWNTEYQQRHWSHLRKAAMRMAKRNPKDYSLKYIFVQDFLQHKETSALGLQWAKEYRKAFPRKPAGLFLLGRVYEGQFGIEGSEAKSKVAISYFQKYLKMAPSNDLYRPAVQARINDIRRRVALFRKKGLLTA